MHPYLVMTLLVFGGFAGAMGYAAWITRGDNLRIIRRVGPTQ